MLDKENTIKFSIDDIQEVATDESVEFAIARIAVLSTRPNSHKVNITEEILRRDGLSVRGKWIIAEYDKWLGDVTTHTNNTQIVGIVPKDAKVDFVETDDGYVVMYVDAIISKIYATDFYRMFRDGVNGRNVSVEMATVNDRELSDGSIDIDGLNIYSICVLGQKVNGSCPDAKMTITKFSEENANEFYNKAFALNKIKSMANDLIDFANSQLELETTSKEDSMEENKEFSEQPKDEDIVMQEEQIGETETEMIKGDTEVEEIKGEEKEMSKTEPVETTEEMSENTDEKDKSEEKEMGCGGEEEKEMSCGDNKEISQKTFALNLDELWCKIYGIIESKYPRTDVEYDESIYSVYGIYEEDGQKFVILRKREDDTYYRANIIVDEYSIDLSDELVEVKIETRFIPIENAKEFAEDEYKEFVEKLFSAEAKDMVEQIVELKKFMDNRIKFDTEKRFSEIMVEPKLCLGENAYNVLFEEGKDLGLNELDAFEQKVKAFCEDAPKKQEMNDDLMRFSCGDIVENTNNENLDVWSRIANN